MKVSIPGSTLKDREIRLPPSRAREQASSHPHDSTLEELEIRLMLEGIYCHYGYDFRDYAPSSLKRRIGNILREERLSSVSALQDRVLHDPVCMKHFLLALSVNVTGMFRDPGFYRAFRTMIVSYLRTYPFIRIWHAGCATGEEVYSMAVLLWEEGLYDRCRIYATDMNDLVSQKAKEGIFPLSSMREYTSNYHQAGGNCSFSGYYTANYDHAIFHPWLKENLIFAEHNLATDSSFNEFNVILCRNVMIYFNKGLQARVHHLLYESIGMFGVLGLGQKESLRFTAHEACYEEIDSPNKLYRKIC